MSSSSPAGVAMAGCDGRGLTAFSAGLVMGTGSTITIKVAYQMTSMGMDGVVRPFEKPLSTTFLMFLAMALSIPLYLLYTHHTTADLSPASKRRAASGGAGHSKPWKLYMLVLIPAVFDLIGTALAKIGLLYTTVSVYQLVRCTVIIITALLKAFVYKDHLSIHMWLGVSINLVAMVLVSSTTFFDRENAVDGRDPRLGILFIVLSCVVQGTQYVFEEKVMEVDGLPPMVLIGLEGLWGVLLMLVVVFPLAYYLPGTDPGGRVENVWDSLVMVRNNQALQIILVAFFITVAMYNIFAIFVTHFLSSIWHAILDNFRPISVWSADLLLYYVISNGRFGEAWTSASWLQFTGMLVLFFGTAVYNGSVPFLLFKDYYYQPLLPGGPPEQVPLAVSRRTASLDFITPVIRTPGRMASPALMRSPFVKRERSSSISRQQQHDDPSCSASLSSSVPRGSGLGGGFMGGGSIQRPQQPQQQQRLEAGVAGAPLITTYGTNGGEEDQQRGRTNSLNRPVFGKAAKPNGVNFDNDGELR